MLIWSRVLIYGHSLRLSKWTLTATTSVLVREQYREVQQRRGDGVKRQRLIEHSYKERNGSR